MSFICCRNRKRQESSLGQENLRGVTYSVHRKLQDMSVHGVYTCHSTQMPVHRYSTVYTVVVQSMRNRSTLVINLSKL